MSNTEIPKFQITRCPHIRKLHFEPTPIDKVRDVVGDMQPYLCDISDFAQAGQKEVKNCRKFTVCEDYEIVAGDFYGDNQMIFSAGFIKPLNDKTPDTSWFGRLQNWQDPELLVQSLVFKA